MTIVGRSQIDHPALGTAGGSALHAAIETIYTNIGNDLAGRYETAASVANSTLTTFTHNFGVQFSDLKVLLYTGTHPNLTRVSDPVASSWTIAANGTNPKTEIDVTTPPSGGPHTFALMVTHGRGAEKLKDLDDVDFSVAPVDGQLFIYDSGTSKWEPAFLRYTAETAAIASNTITPTTGTTMQRITSGTGDIQMVAGPTAGKVYVLVNETGSDKTLKNDTGATAANRIYTGSGADLTLKNQAAVTLIYNSGLSRWVVAGGSGGGGLSPNAQNTSFTAAPGNNYLTDTSGGAITATLPAGTTGATIRFVDATESWGTNNLTITPASGEEIDLLATDESLICDVVRGWVELSWNGSFWAFSSLASTTVGVATATTPGIVSTGAQSFAGLKTFIDGVKCDDDANQSTLNYYREDNTSMASVTFRGDLGGSNSGTVDIRITRIGRVVTIEIPSFTAVVPTNNSIALVCNTNLPTWARPASSRSISCGVYNTSWQSTTGYCFVGSLGRIEFYRDMPSNAWTNSTSCGWYHTQITYTV